MLIVNEYGIALILASFQSNFKAGEYVKFMTGSTNGLGTIISGNQETVIVQLFKSMDSETLQRFHLRPNTNEDEIPEVYQSSEQIEIGRKAIVDVAFILPLDEIESGLFFLARTENTYCIRYIMVNDALISCRPSLYFSRCLVEPLSVCVFNHLNTLAHHLQKALYHQRESSISRKTFCLPLFSMEAFWYLVYRLGGHIIGMTKEQKQQNVKYFNTLWMELRSSSETLSTYRFCQRHH